MPHIKALDVKTNFLIHRCALPPISRPLYFNILSGLLPIESGITHNIIWKPCNAPTIFSVAQKHNLITAAAAYYWISELCNTKPFIPQKHRITNNPKLAIAHGIFYFDDAYLDSHVFADAEALRIRNKPDFLLVHCMGLDDAGHKFGANSLAYKNAAQNINKLLADYIPLWLDNGYSIVITSDHGMDEHKKHFANTDIVRQVPAWTIGHDFYPPEGQSHWFNFCCKHLGILD